MLLLLLVGMLLFSSVSAQLQVVDFAGLDREVKHNNDTLYVVNFWATWCKPCVAEMPAFEAVNGQLQNQKVKMLFVSLNSVKEKTAVEKFLRERNYNIRPLLLNAGNPNIWLPAIDSSWTGAIPATVFYKNGKKVFFHEGDFTEASLTEAIKSKL